MDKFLNSPWTIAISSGVILLFLGLIIDKKFNKKNSVQKINFKLSDWKKNFVSGDNNNITFNDLPGMQEQSNLTITKREEMSNNNELSLINLKKIINILFIDDDSNFNIINILKKQGWNTKIITDMVDVDKYNNVHIFFVDINGVGKKMQLKNQGMDLANYLKDKFTDKKVVIYSTDTNRDMSHPVFSKIDGILSKNAQIYEFTNLIEKLAKEIKI